MTENNTAQKATVAIGSLFIAIALYGLILGGILGNETFTDLTSTGSVANATDAYINTTGWTLTNSGLPTFAYTNLVILDADDNSTIGSGNYTVTANVLYNATAQDYTSLLVSYDYTYTTNATASGMNVNDLENKFSAFIVALIALIAVGGTIIGVLWLLPYIKPLLKRDGGIMGA